MGSDRLRLANPARAGRSVDRSMKSSLTMQVTDISRPIEGGVSRRHRAVSNLLTVTYSPAAARRPRRHASVRIRPPPRPRPARPKSTLVSFTVVDAATAAWHNSKGRAEGTEKGKLGVPAGIVPR